MLKTLIITIFLSIFLCCLYKVVNYKSDNLDYKSIKLIEQTYSIKMASMINENETNKFSKSVSELINKDYLKETVKNNISNEFGQILIEKKHNKKEYIITYDNSNKITKEFCKKIEENLLKIKKIELKSCNKEITQFIIKN